MRRLLAALFAAALAAAPALGQSSSLGPAPVSMAAPVQEFPSREVAARKGTYYVFSTGNAGDFSKGGVGVPAGQFLSARICNLSGGASGIPAQTAYITKRIFDSSGTVAVAYGGIASPAPLTAAMTSTYSGTASSGSNVTVGGSASAVLQMTFGVGTAAVNNATGNAQPTGVGYIYPGLKNELEELRILPPQTCFGQYLDGLPTGLGSTTYYLQYRFYAYVE